MNVQEVRSYATHEGVGISVRSAVVPSRCRSFGKGIRLDKHNLVGRLSRRWRSGPLRLASPEALPAPPALLSPSRILRWHRCSGELGSPFSPAITVRRYRCPVPAGSGSRGANLRRLAGTEVPLTPAVLRRKLNNATIRLVQQAIEQNRFAAPEERHSVAWFEGSMLFS